MPDMSEKPSPAALPDEALILQGPASIAPTAASLAAKAHNLEAIRDAVVDAAKVSAGLWLSYLFVLFYLLVAAGGVTHKDLFLESPVKLPFLNVDLPLLGFFWLGPVIFLVVHAYVLLHFRMLTGKVRVFDDELRAQIDPNQDDSDTRARLRRQLPNDIFVQFLAGPPEVRRGVTGALLELIAWISLVLGPIFLLGFFQLQSLPYHGAWMTWWHRFAVLLDLVLLWLLWPAVVRSTKVSAWLRGTRLAVAGIATILPLYIVFLIASFPGEWLQSHLPPLPLQKQLVAGKIDFENVINAHKSESLWSNRLVLPGFDVIDHARFDSPQKIAALPVTASLRSRDLSWAVLRDASLQKVDFTAAHLEGADFYQAHLEGAELARAKLEDTLFARAHLEGIDLSNAHLEGAVLPGAYLQGANLTDAHLVGANLTSAHLEAAVLKNAHLEGADLSNAHLESANLSGAFLQGTLLNKAHLRGALVIHTFVWRANISSANDEGVYVVNPIISKPCDEPLCRSLETLSQSLREQETQTWSSPHRTKALERLGTLDPRLPLSTEAAWEQQWRALEQSSKGDAHDEELIEQWRSIGCAVDGSPYVLTVLIEEMKDSQSPISNITRELAAKFLDPACVGGRGLSETARAKLEDLSKRAVPKAAPVP
jgi:uncharacterized protein YjbI with pentapeptide repeats